MSVHPRRTAGGELYGADGRRRALGISSAVACFCGGSFVLFQAVSFFAESLSPGTSELGAAGFVITAFMGLIAFAGFLCAALCLRSHGVVRSRWAVPVLLVAGAGINLLNAAMLSGPYGLWLSGLPWPVLILLLPGPAVPLGIASVIVYLALRVRT
ncbi:hypothetical protein ACMA46_00995 [Clavibacter sp. Sh2141]|uniref:hypothetical protein n=1 Tax=Clavibacter sp. Sh2141 TaxID=3395374 RepID=UPI0039BC49C8